MSESGRRTVVNIAYEKKEVSRQLKPYLEEITYTDVATGGSDELSLTLDNHDMRFLGKWKPLKGAKVKAGFKILNWRKEGEVISFRCGKFVIDDLSASGPQDQFVVKAVSAPVKSGFRATPRTHTYKNATIQSIAKKIAKRADVELFYEAGKVRIKEREQSKEPDSSFLVGLCEEYGLGIKIYNNKIVIYDEEKYEKKHDVFIFERKNLYIVSWEWNTTLQRTYTGARVTYTDPADNKKHKAMAGKKGRVYEANISASDKRDAQLKAKALLRNQNKQRTTMRLTIYPLPQLIATNTVMLKGFGKASGKYYIERITHNVSGENGYEETLEMRRVSMK